MTSLVGDAGDCIDSIASKIVITRVSAATTFVKGRPVAPATTSVTVKAVIQPVTGRERQQLPENIRDAEMVKMYVDNNDLLQTVDITTRERADRFLYRSRNYVVQTEFDWELLGGYRKYIAIKLNE